MKHTAFLAHLAAYAVLGVSLYPGASYPGNASLPYIVGIVICAMLGLLVATRLFSDTISVWARGDNGSDEEASELMGMLQTLTPDWLLFTAFELLAIVGVGMFIYNAKEGDASTTWFWIICTVGGLVALLVNTAIWRVAIKHVVRRDLPPKFGGRLGA